MASAHARERAAAAKWPEAPQHYHFKIFVYERLVNDQQFGNSIELDLVDVDLTNAIRRAMEWATPAASEPDVRRGRYWMKYARQCDDPAHLRGLHEVAR